MRILIAEDDPTSHRILKTVLEKAGHETISCVDGAQALRGLVEDRAARFAILDWMMPEMDGPTVARRVREAALESDPYIILLTAKAQKEDIVAGLEAGADDYVTKPFSREELNARIRAGERIVELKSRLQNRVNELILALAEIKTLKGLIPMCAHCKRVRDDEGYWEEVESYVMANTGASVSHGLCPECIAQFYPEYAEIKNRQQQQSPATSTQTDADPATDIDGGSASRP